MRLLLRFLSRYSALVEGYLKFTKTGSMSSKGLKTELIALKTPLFVSSTTLFQALNLSISIIPSQVFTSTLYVSNYSRSKLTTFDNRISRHMFFKVMRLHDINVAKLKEPNVRKDVDRYETS